MKIGGHSERFEVKLDVSRISRVTSLIRKSEVLCLISVCVSKLASDPLCGIAWQYLDETDGIWRRFQS